MFIESFMRFFVTGGAGFIGSHLTQHLVVEGHDVTVIDNLSVGKLSNLDRVRDKIKFIQHDISDYAKMEAILQNADGIFHQAALTSVAESYHAAAEYHQVNVIGSKNIFRLAMKHDIRTVYASSASVYGDVNTMPIVEGSKRSPLNPYGQTKLEVERIAERCICSGARIIGLRYFNVFGPGQTLSHAGVITRFIDRVSGGVGPVIFGDGLQTRDFVYVSDVVRANTAAMYSLTPGGFFNIGSGNPVTIKHLAHMIIRISGSALRPEYHIRQPGDINHSVADISAAANQLNWKPQITLEAGLCKLMKRAITDATTD